MGLLTEGTPLTWEETKKLAQHVREHGINQFISIYKKLKERKGDVLKWGDEIEYIIVKLNKEKKEAKVSLRAEEILAVLNEKELQDPDNVKFLWRPEFASYMIEGTPGKPYGGTLAHFNVVETNMRMRRQEASELLKEDEVVMSITSFPRERVVARAVLYFTGEGIEDEEDFEEEEDDDEEEDADSDTNAGGKNPECKQQ